MIRSLHDRKIETVAFPGQCMSLGPVGKKALTHQTRRPPAPAEGVVPWGAAHQEWFVRHFGHGFGAHAIGDDLPQAANRITLSETETDSGGLPAAKLHDMPHENDRRMMPCSPLITG